VPTDTPTRASFATRIHCVVPSHGIRDQERGRALTVNSQSRLKRTVLPLFDVNGLADKIGPTYAYDGTSPARTASSHYRQDFTPSD
jgi:hypothetical protein